MNPKLLLIYLIGFFVYTQGYWERFTSIPVKGILEILMLVLTIIYFRPKNLKTILLFISVFVVGFCSAVCTGTVIGYFKYIRYLFYSYVLIDIVQQCRLSIRQFRDLFGYFLIIVLLQGIAAVLQVFVLHSRVEGYVGMMSSLGGATATAFPVMIISVTTVVFCFIKSPNYKWNLWMILIVLSMFLIGYSSGKRAIYYFIPLHAVLSLIVSYIFAKKTKIKLGWNKVFIFIALCLLCVPLFFYGVTNSVGYMYELNGNETNKEVVTKMLEITQKYEQAEMDGSTIGRSNTTERLLSIAFTNKNFFLYGRGFQLEKDENAKSQMGVGYGIVGFTRDLFTGGVFFSILTVIFLLHLILRKNYKSKDAFSKSLRMVLVLVFVSIHFFYSADFTISLKLTCVLTLIISFANSRYYYHIKKYVHKKYLKSSIVYHLAPKSFIVQREKLSDNRWLYEQKKKDC